MSIGTKAYTLNRLINEVTSIKGVQGQTAKSLAAALSPRAGIDSAKFSVINAFLNGNLNRVLSGTALVRGSTARTRLLNALKQRKNSGYFFS